MSHAGKVCAHSWRSLFLFPYMPTLPLRLYKLFSEYFLEHAAIIFYKNIKKQRVFLYMPSSSDRSKILQHDEIVFKCNAQWSICGRNTQHEIPTGHTLLRCHFQGQFCHFRFHVATALEIYSNISSLWSQFAMEINGFSNIVVLLVCNPPLWLCRPWRLYVIVPSVITTHRPCAGDWRHAIDAQEPHLMWIVWRGQTGYVHHKHACTAC